MLGNNYAWKHFFVSWNNGVFFCREILQESGVNDEGPQKGKSGKAKKNQGANDQGQPNNDKKVENSPKSVGVGQRSNITEEKPNLEYFGKVKGNKMAVIFHAVLAPHFKFEASQGDRIFIRFGGVAFGNFSDNVAEVQLQR